MSPKRNTFLPFSRPSLFKEDINEVIDSLKSGWITTGPKTEKFEQLFSEYLGTDDAVATNSATAGLNLILRAIDIKPGDKVITPSLTWVSAVNMIELLGAIPIFVDVDPNTLQLIPSEVRNKIDQKTKAIIPVHFAGQPCDLDTLKNIIKAIPSNISYDVKDNIASGEDAQ